MVIHIQRREFIALIGGSAVAWPLAARAQQPAMPVVGQLSSNAPDLLQAFRQGLKDTGCAERENMAIEYPPVPQNQRLPEFAVDLVRRKVDVIRPRPLTISGTYYGSVRPHTDFPLLADLDMDKKLNLDDLISRTYKFDEINEGFRLLVSGSVARGVIEFD
jgi:hypothetical protein